MAYKINITTTNNSRLSTINFNQLPFGRLFSDHMFIADYKNGEWADLRIVPFGNFDIHPANMALHYGQSIFEGMKASKSVDGTPLFLRPEQHARRINLSAERLCMPIIPEDLFLQAIHELISLDSSWIPSHEGSALYIRPFAFAMDEFIGVKPSQNYRFIIFTCPVGPYYSNPVRLIAETTYVRAINGGTGEAKAAGNYAGSLLPARLAQEKGFDQVLWLDGHEFKYVQEVGTMNLFFVINGKVITPATDGAILKGITRDCFITILKNKGYQVEQRAVRINEITDAFDNGTLQEVFGAGTAAVVSPVCAISYKEKLMDILPVENSIGSLLKSEIEGLRNGTIKDSYGWVVPVKSISTANV